MGSERRGGGKRKLMVVNVKEGMSCKDIFRAGGKEGGEEGGVP